ncbi:MAG: hypothetical protein EHM87_14325 [Burkholderiales bacterium]|nr:MAG: hypothetical protein EHM87_14325 [Burkholderiales bacterium]
MSIRFNGASRASRTTVLFANANSFTACGWARINSGTLTGAIFKTNRPSAPSGQIFVGNIAGSTDISIVVNFGADGAYPAYTPTVNQWFFWAITQSGANINAYFAPLGAAVWAATWSSSAGTSFVPDVIDVGGTAANEFFNGSVALYKVWDGVLTSGQLFSQMEQTAPITATGLVSSHLMDGPDVSADLVADAGGASANLALTGTGTTYDSAYPLSTSSTVAVSSATPAGATVAVAGTYTSGGSPTISVSLVAGATGVTQAPVAATLAAGNWSCSFANVPPGVYTPQAVLTDGGGSVSATGAAAEIIGISGTGELPSVYVAGAISITPEVLSLAGAGTATLTVVDQAGMPLDGVTVQSLNATVVTVTSPTNAAGQVVATGVGSGVATITASFAEGGSTLSDSVSVTVGSTLPSAPTGLVATALSSTAVRLTWVDNTSGETSFLVERAPALAGGAAGTYATAVTAAANAVTADDLTAQPGTTYFYRVRTVAAAGQSAPSNVVSVTMPAAVDATPPAITLSSSSPTVTAPNGVLTLMAVATDNIGVTEVRFYRNGVQIGSTLTAPNANGSYAVTQTFASSADNGTIQFTARASDAAGNSTLSAAVPVVVNIPIAQQPTPAPSALTVGAVTATSMRLAWTNNATDYTAVFVDRKLGVGGTWARAAALPGDAVEFLATGLLGNALYVWRVLAQGPALLSGYSNEVSAATSSVGVTALASLGVSAETLSGLSGQAVTVTYTARGGNGTTLPGVTITPFVSVPGVATVVPENGVTDSSGAAAFTVTFGSSVAQAQLEASASDGQSTLSRSDCPVVQVFTLPSVTTALVKEFQQEQLDPKYVDEITPLVWDFSPYLGRGEVPVTIVARESAPTTSPDRDPASASMLFGDAIIVGDRVLQWVRDGVPGVSYFLRCRVRTSIGRVVVAEVRMRIYRAPGARVASSSPVVD